MYRTLILLAVMLLPLFAHASTIGLTAEEAYERVQKQGDQILFIDVRDPVEIMFVGFTDEVHVNVPFLMIDRTRWNDERGVYQPVRNPDFAAEVAAALKARGLSNDAEIITMCRSGSERGEPSAKFLRENGFPNARFVINGFQGSVVKEGQHAGFRLQNGWQNSGLPWGFKLNPEKMYRVDR